MMANAGVRDVPMNVRIYIYIANNAYWYRWVDGCICKR